MAPDGVVPHRLDARESLRGLLRDQALAVSAALAEYRLCGDRSLLGWSERAVDWTLAHLWDEPTSAFRAEPESSAGAARLPPMFPLLANGEMALALADLADHTGRAEYRRPAERVVLALASRAVRSPAGPAVALATQRLDDKAPEANLDGAPADPRARALARTVVAALGPTAIVRWTGAGVARPHALCEGSLSAPPPRSARAAAVAGRPRSCSPRYTGDLSSLSPGEEGLWSEEAS